MHQYAKLQQQLESVIKITERVFSAILKKFKGYINLRNATDRRQLVAQKIDELSFCIGYIDGSYIKLAKNPISNHEVYFCHQRIYSVKLQVVFDHNLRILHAEVGSIINIP